MGIPSSMPTSAPHPELQDQSEVAWDFSPSSSRPPKLRCQTTLRIVRIIACRRSQTREPLQPLNRATLDPSKQRWSWRCCFIAAQEQHVVSPALEVKRCTGAAAMSFSCILTLRVGQMTAGQRFSRQDPFRRAGIPPTSPSSSMASEAKCGFQRCATTVSEHVDSAQIAQCSNRTMRRNYEQPSSNKCVKEMVT